MKLPKLILIFTLSLALLGTIWLCLNKNFNSTPQGVANQALHKEPFLSTQHNRELPGETFIKQYMINPDGTLRTNLQPSSKRVAEQALGGEALSESLGLWLLYAIEKDDPALFEQGVETLTTYFLKDGWIYWKLGNDEQVVTTNALIDDLRIMDALYAAAIKWEAKHFNSLADEIAESILKKHLVDMYFVDFYDHELKRSSNSLTLSYLKTSAFIKMYEQQLLSEELYRKTLQFLQQLPTREGFYPFSYELSTQTYLYDDEVNLIDQFYIIYHRAQAGIDSEPIWSFLKREFYKHGLLYGRYHALQKKPSVNFESPAVYSLAIFSALEMGDAEFALDLYYRMSRQQTLNPESEWYGGYIDYSQQDTHIFDNLLPLLAERKLFNEGLLY